MVLEIVNIASPNADASSPMTERTRVYVKSEPRQMDIVLLLSGSSCTPFTTSLNPRRLSNDVDADVG